MARLVVVDKVELGLRKESVRPDRGSGRGCGAVLVTGVAVLMGVTWLDAPTRAAGR